MKNKRMMLDTDDFKKLTKGEIITKDGIDIALGDIGWYRMLEIIRTNMVDSDIK